jgi:hypothetical protein
LQLALFRRRGDRRRRSRALARRYNERKSEFVARTIAAHGFSPHDQTADVEREGAAVAGSRPLRIHTFNYASIIAQTKVALGTNRERGSMFASPYRADPHALLAAVSAQLGLDRTRAIGSWMLRDASRTPDGIVLTWVAARKPTLTILLRPYVGVRDFYRRFGPMTLSYMNAFDRPYPLDIAVEALFDVIGARLAEWDGGDWRAAHGLPAVAATRRAPSRSLRR